MQELQYTWVLLNLIYFGVLGSPFSSLGALPELKEKAAELMRYMRRHPVDRRTHAASTNTRQVNGTNTQPIRNGVIAAP